MRATSEREQGSTSPIKLLLGVLVAGALVAGVLVLDLPGRIAGRGSGNLDALMRPTTTVSFGETAEVAGRGERPPLEVTAEHVVPVRSTTRGVRPAKGERFVGVPLVIRNDGSEPWLSAPHTSIGLTDQRGRGYLKDDRVRRVRGQRVLPVSLELEPKHTARGMVVFSVPRAARITMIQLVVGQGITRTVQWVPGG